MNIESIHIKNLRAFKDQLISLDDYNCFVGPNGAGKSTVLCALNIFFRESQGTSTNLITLSKEDFHLLNTSNPIEIILTFVGLNEEAQADFADYYRQGKLVISAVATYNDKTESAEVKQFGQRMGMPQLKNFFEAEGDGAKVPELKAIYAELCKQLPDLKAAGTKEAMITALREYEAARPEQCELIPSEDQFYGVSKGTNRLAKHLQWVYVPAVKDASEEQIESKNSALGKLLARAVRSKVNFADDIEDILKGAQQQYQCLLDRSQSVLDEVTQSLQKRICEWAHPEANLKVQWQQDPQKSIKVEAPFAGILAGEGNFEGQLARFGHGLQRSFLLALLQELASSEDSGPRLIIGCEEPELYQHPPQERHLSAVLQLLSQKNAQVIITTHSPHFVSGTGFEKVRMVRRHIAEKYAVVKHMAFEQIASTVSAALGEKPLKPAGTLAKVHQVLQPSLNEMFFTHRLILVEGLEDFAYISAWLSITGRWDEYRRLGCHIVPCNGKSMMIQPLSIARGLDIPVFLVFDGDSGAKHPEEHKKDNVALLRLIGADATNPFPPTTMWGPNYAVWSTDMGTVVKADVENQAWEKAYEYASRVCGQAGDIQKNAYHIGARLAWLFENGIKPASLETLSEKILTFAK
ncbi:MAG: AAA family ATPase [Sporomusaceae bacterium]|nr:AAA family ATPase [Sporomusaceae bacterium]